jgi:AAA+ superfamily predicted ATPase
MRGAPWTTTGGHSYRDWEPHAAQASWVSGIRQYKHGLTRRYLLLDDDGRAYEAAGRNEFREIPFEKALARVAAPLAEMGEPLETPYDDAYIRRKDEALRAAGIEVLRIRVVPRITHGGRVANGVQLNPKESGLRPDREATSPILWVLLWVFTQFGRFLRDGYNEIRQLVSANTAHGVKKVFTGSLITLVLALAAVAVIASQIHPAAVILAVALVLLMVYGRNLFRRMALFVGYMFCGVILFIGAVLIIVGPIEKAYPLFAKVIAVFLFVVLCVVIPALLSLKNAIIARPAGGAIRKATLAFADVGGLEEAKKQIRELVQANLDGRKLGKYGVCRNGILFHGPRGTGKTFLAEAVAGEFGLKFLCVPAATLHAKWVGETERRIELLFQEAIASRPALLFFDEIDALGARRQQIGDGEDPGGAGRGYNSATSQLMTCIDRNRSDSGVIVAAATNFYDGLDRALIREGRFDLHLRIDLPNGEERTRMFEAQLAKRPAGRFDLQAFARRTPGWSAAKISALVDRAAVFAAQERRKIEEKDLARALAETGGKDRAALREVDWDDVVLPTATEADLRALVRLMDPAYADRLKLPMPSGLLLIGPPEPVT